MKLTTRETQIAAMISQREAVRRYGHGCISQWRKDGKIVPVKEGGTIFYPTEKLEILTKTNKHERGTGKNRAAGVAKRQPDGGGASGHNKSRRGDETA